MTRLAERFDAGPLSVRASIALSLAIVGVVVVFLVGTHQQRTRQLPHMASASITETASQGPPEGWPVVPEGSAVPVDHGHAQSLANIMNRLPHFPNGTFVCPTGTGGVYVVHFVTTKGKRLDAHVPIGGGCDTIDVIDGGTAWGWDRWDRDGNAINAIAALIRAGS